MSKIHLNLNKQTQLLKDWFIIGYLWVYYKSKKRKKQRHEGNTTRVRLLLLELSAALVLKIERIVRKFFFLIKAIDARYNVVKEKVKSNIKRK